MVAATVTPDEILAAYNAHTGTITTRLPAHSRWGAAARGRQSVVGLHILQLTQTANAVTVPAGSTEPELFVNDMSQPLGKMTKGSDR